MAAISIASRSKSELMVALPLPMQTADTISRVLSSHPRQQEFRPGSLPAVPKGYPLATDYPVTTRAARLVELSSSGGAKR